MNRAMSSAGSANATASVRTAVAGGILLVIVLAHVFRLGRYLHGSLFRLYYSYFSDIAIPFGAYFLFCLQDVHRRLFRDWRLKAVVVFGLASSAEVMQGFGVPALGRTFDPLDFMMFGTGVLLAVVVDRVFLDRLLAGWSLEKEV